MSFPLYIPGLLKKKSTLRNNLVLELLFSGNALDTSGFGNNGTVNGATLTSDKDGNLNSAYLFDGSNDYISVPANASMNNGVFSYSYWVNILAFNGTDPLINYHKFATYEQLFSSRRLVLAYIVGGSTKSLYGASTVLSTGIWYHVVLIHGSTQDYIYIDNNIQTLSYITGSFTPGLDTPTNPIIIGANGVLTTFTNCILTKIRKWNRELTLNEISYLYNE